MAIEVEVVEGRGEADDGPAPSLDDACPRAEPLRLAYGVCLFDGDDPEGGWACRDGEEPFRVAVPSGLATDTIWLTNLSYVTFRESGLSAHPWFRFDGFLRVPVRKIIAEWGAEGFDAPARAKLVSRLFARIMRLASRRLAGQGALRAYALHIDLSATFKPGLVPRRELLSAVGEAVQNWTRTQRRGGKDLVHIVLRKPRLAHALDLLRWPAPGAEWEYVSGRRLPREGAAEWLARLDRPVLARVTVEADTDVGTLLAFGTGQEERRFWAAHPELKALTAFADVVVHDAYIGERYVRCEDLLQDGLEVLRTPAAAASWSAGLLAENIWVGACRTERDGERVITLRGAWMRSLDRVKLFQAAVRLHMAGFLVMGYGVGGVHVAVDEESIEPLVHEAFRLGLAPPLSATFDVARGPVVAPPDPAAWGGPREASLLAYVMASGRPDLLWKLDGLYESDPEHARRTIAGIQAELVG